MEDKAFYRCISLELVGLPESLSIIGDRAFEECALVSLSLPVGVSRVGDYAFANCYWLTTFLFPRRRVVVGSSVFSGCAGLEVLVLPRRGMRRLRRRELLRIPGDTQIIYHNELELSWLLTELGSSGVSDDRRRELCSEIRRLAKSLRKSAEE